MKLLKLAIETQNWDLAAHIVVYKIAQLMAERTNPDGKKENPQGRTQGKPKRP